MKGSKGFLAGLVVAIPVLVFVGLFPLFHISAAEKKITETHPVPLQEKPWCEECHHDDTVEQKPISIFNHGSDWIAQHRFYASQTQQLCNACHKSSFCMDCHAYKDELKPSDKYGSSVDRWLPHRGDYLFQHRIDGRVDPTACYRCHGRQNNTICRRCHK